MRPAILLFAFAAAAFGQLDDDTLTVTSTRTVSLVPDQVTVTIFLNGPMGGSVDEAIAALPGGGVAASDLSSVSTIPSGADPSLQWIFNRTVNFSQLGSTLAALDSLSQKKGDYSVSYSVQGTLSANAQQAPALCPLPTMVSEARAQAQRVADAAGVRVGAVVSLSRAQPPGFVPVPVFRSGDFASARLGLVGVISSAPLPTASSCAITVQFRLLR
jgi:uncharacterized protein YggE